MAVLHGIGDVFAMVLYRIVRYRRSVVRENLVQCFPEFNSAQILKIEWAYYRHMSSLIVEFWKQLSVDQRFYKRRVELENVELFHEFQAEGKSVMLVMGHVNSWEWVLQKVVAETRFPFYTLYRPLSNKRVDAIVHGVRSRYGADVIDMHTAVRYLLEHRNEVLGGCFIADQNPPRQNAVWTEFLGRETAFFSGFQKLAIRFNQPVLYLEVLRVRRGYYTANFRTLCLEPKSCSEQELTDRYATMLMENIKKQPESWLWSHRRWKYTRTS